MKGFKPARWLSNPHVQTLLPRLFQVNIKTQLVPERLELPDGDFIDLLWSEKESQHIVIVLHGLEGSIESRYSCHIMNAIIDQGWTGLFMHFRGCSKEHNRLDRSYHSGDTGDIAFLMDTIRRRKPECKIAVVAYSLGGNALLKYLGESKDETPIDCAVAVSVPFELDKGAKKLEKGLSKIYQHYLIGKLQRKFRDKFRDRPAPVHIDNIKDLNTFYTFDDQITAPLHGFSSADDYYTQSSSRQFLSSIQRPTLIIHARDDPFLSPDAIPATEELSPFIELELSDKGGHVGFVQGTPWKPEYWLVKRIPAFIQTALEQ